MADTMYAWSDIRYGAEVNDKTGHITKVKTIPAGEAVDAGKLGIDDDAFQHLVDSGAVRNTKFPKMPDNWGGSPLDYVRHLRSRQMGLEDISGTSQGSHSAPSEMELLLDEDAWGPLEVPKEEKAATTDKAATK